MALVASLQCDLISLSTRRIRSSHDAKPDTVKLATVAKSSVRHKKGNLGSLRLARTTRDSRLEALAVQDNAGSSGSSLASSEETTYYFCVANAKFMLDDEEQFQELMKERLRHFGEMGREQDFWLLYEPAFLQKFPDVASRVKRPAVALVSTDKLWMTFMKLRMDRVLKGEYEAASVEAALKSKPVDIQFDSPGKWVAPYPKYEGPWWTPFLPPQVE